MKKIILSILTFSLVSTFSSCKKDYTCSCATGSVALTSTINDTKKNAKEECDKGDIIITGTVLTECSIL